MKSISLRLEPELIEKLKSRAKERGIGYQVLLKSYIRAGLDSEPVYTKPVYTEPEPDEPVYTKPVYTEPEPDEPVYTKPVYTEPEPDEPVYTPTINFDDI